MEHEPIASLQDPVPPGLKMTLFGPLTCRRGLILLTSKNVRVRGGFVEELQPEMGLKAALVKRLERDGNGRAAEPRNQMPTQSYKPRNIPVKYKPDHQPNSGRGRQSAASGDTRRRAPLASTSRSANVSRNQADVFGEDDEDDLLLASVDLDAVSTAPASADTGDVFDDEDDELFSQIQMPGSNTPAGKSFNKRRRT